MASALLLAPVGAAAQSGADGPGPGFAERGGQPNEARVDGRLALRDVYSFDNQTPWDVHILFLDSDVRAYDVAEVGSGALNLRLDSRLLFDLTQDDRVSEPSDTSPGLQRNERRFGVTQTVTDIRLLYAELEHLGPVDATLGRIWFYEAGGAWVDGGALKLHLSDDWSVAAFGGLAPDPIDWDLDTQRQTGGGFLAYRTRRADASLAYTTQLYDGALDRHYAFSRGHWSVPVGDTVQSLFLSYYGSLDLQNEDPVLTTVFTNASCWLNSTLNLSAHYARFATSRLRQTQQGPRPEDNQRDLLGEEINTGSYDQVRLAAAERFGGHYYLYQQLDYRQRDLLDRDSATYYRAGIRDSAVLGTQLALHSRVSVRNNFASDSSEFLAEGAYRFGDRFELEGAFIFQRGRSLIAEQSQDIYLINVAGTFDFTPDVYLTLDYELNSETNIVQEEQETAGNLNIHTVFTRLTYRL
ncbi:MAG: hypothetical protein CMH57_06820 [Myxococcales bacterium]|nr:hypothetical protein [Myxococcales bacterium]